MWSIIIRLYPSTLLVTRVLWATIPRNYDGSYLLEVWTTWYLAGKAGSFYASKWSIGEAAVLLISGTASSRRGSENDEQLFHTKRVCQSYRDRTQNRTIFWSVQNVTFCPRTAAPRSPPNYDTIWAASATKGKYILMTWKETMINIKMDFKMNHIQYPIRLLR
jgi:hypothetical protein